MTMAWEMAPDPARIAVSDLARALDALIKRAAEDTDATARRRSRAALVCVQKALAAVSTQRTTHSEFTERIAAAAMRVDDLRDLPALYFSTTPED